MKRLITIIVPVYKVEKWLDRCVESIVNQTYKNIEIILIDDGSPDRCPQICDEWGKQDNRIKVVHKKNGGLSDSRNTGIRMAQGEYILFVDSDDYIDINAVKKLESYAEDEDMIVGEATIYKYGEIIHRVHTNLEENHVYSGTDIAVLAIQKGEWFAASCYNMYRRQFLLDNRLFFMVGILHEDNEIQPRLFLNAKKVKYLHFEFYKYVVREDSICETPGLKNMRDLFLAYERWVSLNATIKNKKVYKAYSGALCKAYIHTCREFRYTRNEYPKGINNIYLLKNALNIKEFIKTVAFLLLRKVYVRL